MRDRSGMYGHCSFVYVPDGFDVVGESDAELLDLVLNIVIYSG